jgi:hypothetical protein
VAVSTYFGITLAAVDRQRLAERLKPWLPKAVPASPYAREVVWTLLPFLAIALSIVSLLVDDPRNVPAKTQLIHQGAWVVIAVSLIVLVVRWLSWLGTRR